MRPRAWLALVLAVVSAGCDKNPFSDEPPLPSPEPPQPPPARRRASDVAAMLDGDGGVEIDRSDPPPPAGDLRAEIDGFSSLDACVSAHANLDPLVGDALRALGYDTLVRDACRVLQSLKLKDPSPCAGIAASGLASRCESLVAMETQAPDHCPWIASTDRTLGRDPVCLGVATHDPRLCAATFPSQRGTCEALATGDAKRCARGTPEEIRRCQRELEREQRVFAVEEHEAHDAAMPKGKATLKGTSGAPDPDPSELDLAPDLEPGVVVAPEPSGGTRIDVARERDMGLRLPSRGGAAADRTRFAAALVVEGTGAKVTRFEITPPKGAAILCPSPHCTVRAEVPKGEWRRGGPITVVFDATFDLPTGKLAVHAQIDSFVRDVVTRSSLYAPR